MNNLILRVVHNLLRFVLYGERNSDTQDESSFCMSSYIPNCIHVPCEERNNSMGDFFGMCLVTLVSLCAVFNVCVHMQYSERNNCSQSEGWLGMSVCKSCMHMKCRRRKE